MTRIRFLHSAPDRLHTAAAWVALCWQERRPLTIYAPGDLGERLDRQLWTHNALSFVPHCRADSPLANETPILIDDRLDTLRQDQLLLNLSNELPPGFARFEELVEIVSTADADKLPARERYKHYRERGYELQNEDISGGF
ncbi:MAG TPA: DNA polymerase III subunit chi [Rhodocyclaceae bacterium]